MTRIIKGSKLPLPGTPYLINATARRRRHANSTRIPRVSCPHGRHCREILRLHLAVGHSFPRGDGVAVVELLLHGGDLGKLEELGFLAGALRRLRRGCRHGHRDGILLAETHVPAVGLGG